VIALSRRAPASAHAGEEWISGELSEDAVLERLVRDADAVVHAAAWVHREAPDAASRAACFTVNQHGTERLLAAVRRRGGRPPFAFVSTSAVYGEAFEDAPEAGPFAPRGAYAESKLAAERAVAAAHDQGAVRGAILRPAMVYGPGAPGNIARLEAMVRRGVAPRVAGGRNRKSIVHADDLAAVILAVLDRAGPALEVYNVASEPPPTMREVGEALAAGLGRRLAWIPIPGVAWSAGAAASNAWARVSGSRGPGLARTMQVYASTTTVRASAVRERLGARFRDAAEGLRESVRPG
jgi:UDP-glucose 4-epimerase